MQPTQPPPADSEGGFDFRELLRILFRYRWLVFGVAAAVTLGVALWTLQLPRIYEAVASIEYDPNPPRPLGHEIEDVADPIGNFWLTKEFYETQNHILASRGLAERVVQRLGLNHDPDFMDVEPERREGWEGAPVEAAARILQYRISIEPVKDTRIVEIHYRDQDPERAKTVANAIADAYIEKTMEDRLGSTISALEWLREQLDSLQGSLENAELALHEFKRENNVLSVSLEDRQNIVAGTIQRLSEALDEARLQRVRLRARVEQLRQANTDDPLEANATVFDDDPQVKDLRARYNEKAATRESLLTRYGENHPSIASLTAELETLKGQLRRRIDALIDNAEADLEEARTVERGLRAELDQAHDAGLEINLKEIEYDRLNRARDNKEKLYETILSRTTETQLTQRLRVNTVRVVDRALKPGGPVSPRIHLNLLVGLAAGFLLGLALAILMMRLDQTIKRVEDAEAIGLPVLGILPLIDEEKRPAKRRFRRAGAITPGAGDLVVHTHPKSAVAECCRTIRTNLTFMSAEHPARSVVVTSAGPREGKTTVASSLAIVNAQSGKRVLLIDTDLRKPRVHRAFEISGTIGITQVLVGERDLRSAITTSQVEGVDVLPCGPIPPNPAELLHTPRFGEIVSEALRLYDFVVFDSPPLGAVTDGAVIAPQVDGVIIVAKARSTTRDSLRAALRQIADVGAKILGGVLNGVDLSERQYGYGQYYYYRRDGYYAAEEGDDSTADAAA